MRISVHEKNSPETVQYYKDVCDLLSGTFSDCRIRSNFPFLLIDEGRFPSKGVLGNQYYATTRLKTYDPVVRLQVNMGPKHGFIQEFEVKGTPEDMAEDIAMTIEDKLPELWKHFDEDYDEAIKARFGGLYTHFYDKYLDVIEEYKKQMMPPSDIRREVDKLIDRDSD